MSLLITLLSLAYFSKESFQLLKESKFIFNVPTSIIFCNVYTLHTSYTWNKNPNSARELIFLCIEQCIATFNFSKLISSCNQKTTIIINTRTLLFCNFQNVLRTLKHYFNYLNIIIIRFSPCKIKDL